MMVGADGCGSDRQVIMTAVTSGPVLVERGDDGEQRGEDERAGATAGVRDRGNAPPCALGDRCRGTRPDRADRGRAYRARLCPRGPGRWPGPTRLREPGPRPAAWSD